MNKSFFVNLKVYPVDVLVVFGEEEFLLSRLQSSQCSEWLRWYEEELEAMDQGYVVYSSQGILLWLRQEPHDQHSMSVLCHEIFHLTVKIMQFIGSDLSVTSEEAYAYLLQYLSQQIFNKLTIFKKNEAF